MKSIRPIGTTTQLCAVIGNPVAHSLSPAIHNAAFGKMDLDFVYVAFHVVDLGSALKGMRALNNFRGMSITIPHKVDAMRHVDEISDVDRSIGSINTVINSGGVLKGYGTDGPGALRALHDAHVDLNGRHVLMLGSGGAARAVSFTLARNAGISCLTILDINDPMRLALADDLRAGTSSPIESEPLNEGFLADAMARSDIVINSTPIGMHPNHDSSIIPLELFRPGQVVFDIVYNPLETRLLKEARSRGLLAISGVEMFINQAALQFELFTGMPAPVEVMRGVVMEKLTGG